jgi:hypothetical protein
MHGTPPRPRRVRRAGRREAALQTFVLAHDPPARAANRRSHAGSSGCTRRSGALGARLANPPARRNAMSDAPRQPQSAPEPVPLGQRLLDRPFLLLVACLVVMFVFYTGWGLVELASLTEAPLP